MITNGGTPIRQPTFRELPNYRLFDFAQSAFSEDNERIVVDALQEKWTSHTVVARRKLVRNYEKILCPNLLEFLRMGVPDG